MSLSVTLDIRTLTFVLMLVSAILSLLMLYIWRTNKTYPGFGLWTLANCVGAVGFFLMGTRGVAPDFISIVIANTLTMGCLALTLAGIRTFAGKSTSKILCIAALLAQAGALAYYTYAVPDVPTRIYIASILAVGFSAWIGYEFLKLQQTDRLFATSFGAKVFGLFALFMASRVVLTFYFSHLDNLYSPDWIQSLTFMMLIIFVMIWTVNFIMLNSERLQRELRVAQVELEKIATTDFLTGISNNRSFTDVSENEVRRAMRFRHSLSAIIMDIDDFKAINDTYGHSTGDVVLRKIVEVSKTGLRTIDTMGRLGGEEFGILLPHTDIAGAKTVAAYLRSAIEEAEVRIPNGVLKVTASFGVAELRPGDVRLRTLLDRADGYLYEAKRSGKNCVRSDKPMSNLRLVSTVT